MSLSILDELTLTRTSLPNPSQSRLRINPHSEGARTESLKRYPGANSDKEYRESFYYVLTYKMISFNFSFFEFHGEEAHVTYNYLQIGLLY